MTKSVYEVLVSLEGAQQFQANILAIEQSIDAVSNSVNALVNASRNVAVEYDAALRKFNTIANESTGTIDQQKQAFENLTESLGNTLTETEALNAGYEVLSSGYSDLNDITGILTASQKAAVGGFSDLTTVADAATTILNVYGDTYSSVATVTQKANDILSQAIAVQNLGKITVGEYAQSIGVLAPTAKIANVSLSEMNGAIALATSRGVKAETAIRGFRQLLVNLLRPTDRARGAAAQFGIELGSSALKAKGYAAILNQIIEVAKNNPAILSDIFSDTDSLNIAAILSEGKDQLNQFTQEINKARESGILDRQFEIIKESDAQKTQRILNQLQTELRKIGEGVVASLDPFIQVLSSLLRVFDSIPDSAKEFVGSLSVITAVAVGGTAAISKLKLSFDVLSASAKSAGLSLKSISLSFAPLAVGALFVVELSKAFNLVNEAAAKSRQNVQSLNELIDNIKASGVVESAEKVEDLDKKIDNLIQRNQKRIEETGNVFTRVVDGGISLVNFGFKGLLAPAQAFLQILGQIVGFVPGFGAIGDKIKGIAEGFSSFKPFATFEEATKSGAEGAIERTLQSTQKLRDTLGTLDFSKLTASEVNAAIDATTKAIQNLEEAAVNATSEREAKDLLNESKILQSQLDLLKQRQEALDATVESRTKLSEVAEQATEQEANFSAALESSNKKYEAIIKQEENLAKLRVARGEVSESEALADQANALREILNERLSFLDAEAEKYRQNSALVARIRQEQQDLEIQSILKIAEVESAARKARLDEIEKQRQLEIALIEAAGGSEIEIARKAFETKQKYAQQEAEEIKKQINSLAKGSEERVDLEIRLAKLTAETARERVELTRKEIEEKEKLAEIEKENLQNQVEITEQIIELKKQLNQETQDAIEAENNLLDTLSGAIDDVTGNIRDHSSVYTSYLDTLESIREERRKNAVQAQFDALQDLEISENASEAEKERIKLENERRKAQREAIKSQEEQLERQRKAVDSARELRDAEYELQKAIEESNIDRERSRIIQEELARVGIKTGDIYNNFNDAENAKFAIELLQIQNQKELLRLKQEQQIVELESAKLRQQAAIAEQQILLSSGTLNQQQIAQAQVRLQLAQNQLALLNRQESALRNQQELERRNLSIREALFTAGRNLPNNTEANSAPGSQRFMGSTDSPVAKQIQSDNARLIANQQDGNRLLQSLEAQLGNLANINRDLLSVTQRLPGEIARQVPKPVVPR